MKTSAQLKVGFLGGGQLARMLALQAHNMGLQPYVLSLNKNDPAAQVTSHWVQGHPNEAQDLMNFFSQVDIVTFESEFIDPKKVQAASTMSKVKVYPKTKIMSTLRDRLSQKTLLEKHKLKTSPFIKISKEKDLSQAHDLWPKGFVLKKRLFGYDGYGTFIFKENRKNHKIDFNNDGFIAEAFVPFKKELAISVVRNTKGQVVFLPLVETFQKNSRCLWVKGPLKHKSLARLQTQLKAFVTQTKYVGLITFELFDTGRELLVNEVAPRVHNSAHYSLDGLSSDQFSLHIRAVLGMSLATPEPLKSGFAMYNLLGSSTKQPSWRIPPQTYLHWYGKADNRKGRKMGHINVLSHSPQAALNKVLKVKKEFKL